MVLLAHAFSRSDQAFGPWSGCGHRVVHCKHVALQVLRSMVWQAGDKQTLEHQVHVLFVAPGTADSCCPHIGNSTSGSSQICSIAA